MYEYFHFTNDYYQSLNEEFKLDDKIRLKEEPANLYDVVKRMYDGSPNFSRVLTISRLEEYNSKKEKLTRDMIVNSISEEIKSSIQKPRNCFIVILGSQYVMVLLESSGEKLLDYLTGLNVAIQAGRSIQTNCLVLSFIEDVSALT